MPKTLYSCRLLSIPNVPLLVMYKGTDWNKIVHDSLTTIITPTAVNKNPYSQLIDPIKTIGHSFSILMKLYMHIIYIEKPHGVNLFAIS